MQIMFMLTPNDNTNFSVVLSDGAGTTERMRIDSGNNFTYNPSTNELNVPGKVDCPEFEGTADVANQIAASETNS